MFARIAEIITQKLKENNTITSEQYEICRFGFQQGLTIVLNVLTTIAIGGVMGKLWQAVLFLLFYAPLRSYAGGYHAKTSTRCYMYSIFLIITVLLVIKLSFLTRFICIIAFILSGTIIVILAPVEDSNKPLDSIEIKVYRKRTKIIVILESAVFIISCILKWKSIIECLTLVFMVMSIIMCVGKCKNMILKSKNNIHKSCGKWLL